MSDTSANEVKFYKSKNCMGTPVCYKEGDSCAFPANHPDNDKYLSCVVGDKVWVNCYQHNDTCNSEPGVHLVLKSGTHVDLCSLKGLSKFQVLSHKFEFAVDVKLVDNVSPGVDTKCAYEFTLIPHNSQPVKTFSGNDYVQCPVPKLTSPNAEVVCQLVCKQVAWPCSVVCNGSVCFQFEPSTGLLKCKKIQGFPSNLSATQEGKTNFCFSLNSLDC
eukprot:gene9119-10695_t